MADTGLSLAIAGDGLEELIRRVAREVVADRSALPGGRQDLLNYLTSRRTGG